MDPRQKQIVESYGWAMRYASRCTINFPSCYDRDELTSAGILGYVTAAYRFDESKGNSFRAFCAARIRGAILDEIRGLTWEPRSARRNSQLMARKKNELESSLQRKATTKELADSMGMNESDLLEMQRLSQPPSFVSLDDETNESAEDERLPLREIIADQSVTSPLDEIELSEKRLLLSSSISKLPRIEGRIIVLHYIRNISFSDIAREMKLTPSRISQLHHQALASLKKHMAKVT